MEVIDLSRLNNDDLKKLAKDRSAIVEQNGSKFVIVIPQSIDLDKDDITADDLIITPYRELE